jgi:hypothetical protein
MSAGPVKVVARLSQVRFRCPQYGGFDVRALGRAARRSNAFRSRSKKLIARCHLLVAESAQDFFSIIQHRQAPAVTKAR